MEFHSVRDALSFAVSLERISQNFYRELAHQVSDSGIDTRRTTAQFA